MFSLRRSASNARPRPTASADRALVVIVDIVRHGIMITDGRRVVIVVIGLLDMGSRAVSVGAGKSPKRGDHAGLARTLHSYKAMMMCYILQVQYSQLRQKLIIC